MRATKSRVDSATGNMSALIDLVLIKDELLLALNQVCHFYIIHYTFVLYFNSTLNSSCIGSKVILGQFGRIPGRFLQNLQVCSK